MEKYIQSFKDQLKILPESGYKKQLAKYGERVARNIYNSSIVSLVSQISLTDKDIEFSVDELSGNIPVEKIKPVYIQYGHDLGVVRELIYDEPSDMNTIDKAVMKSSSDINNHFMNYVLTDSLKSVHIELGSLKYLLEKQVDKRILIVGNGTLDNLLKLKYAIDSTDLKYAGNTPAGDLVYHSKHIPTQTIFIIELKNGVKLLEYVVKNPLTIVGSNYMHKAGIILKNHNIITKYSLI